MTGVADPPFSTSTSDDRSVVLVEVHGDIDLTNAADLQRALVDAATGAAVERVDVDLTDVSFMDSSGLRALIVGRQEASAHATQVRVVAASKAARRLFEVAGITDLLS